MCIIYKYKFNSVFIKNNQKVNGVYLCIPSTTALVIDLLKLLKINHVLCLILFIFRIIN